MADERFRFDGQVAVVTGAGSGLGRCYAQELALRGAAVVCNDIVAAAAEATAEDIVRRGGKAVPETSSVDSPQGGQALVRKAIDEFGSIEILINNAGQLRNAAFEDLTIEDIDDVIRTHLSGAFYVTQPAYRHMKTAGYGRILFTSSAAGLFGLPWQANYGAAKAGVVGLCQVVALEGAEHGITANVILPQALGTNAGGESQTLYSPEELKEISRVFGRVARSMTVDNVAPLVLFLASRSCGLTGRIFSAGCGHVGEVFLGAARGWFAPDRTKSSVEEVAAHIAEAADRRNYVTFESALEEIRFIGDQQVR
jgi:NAD(P)-dependent dehydrogenase (short-subunit alcohol dehydrogenase family)